MTLIIAFGTLVGIVLALLNIREKLWPKPPKPHPLEAAVRDVAAAFREWKVE